jgi:hypothetical protein
MLGVTMTKLFALLQATMEGQLQLSSLEPCRTAGLLDHHSAQEQIG